MNIQLKEILKLSLAERVQLVEDIWDSIAEDPDAVPLSPAKRKDLDRRKRAHKRNPTAAKPWSEIRERLRRRR